MFDVNINSSVWTLTLCLHYFFTVCLLNLLASAYTNFIKSDIMVVCDL